MTDNLIGTIVAGHRIERLVGRGGMGLVYEAVELRERVTIGRSADCDVGLGWDREVSRLHAQLEPVGTHWVLVDDGLSRNGSFVNGERVVGRRRLRDGDRLCFGETPVVYRASAELAGDSTLSVMAGLGAISITPTQRRILVALCRPVRDSAFATPPPNREIADEVGLSVDAVKAHLRLLFERFGLEHLPQNQKRARLAAMALLQGIVTVRRLIPHQGLQTHTLVGNSPRRVPVPGARRDPACGRTERRDHEGRRPGGSRFQVTVRNARRIVYTPVPRGRPNPRSRRWRWAAQIVSGRAVLR